jgi:hypothetical protein
MSLLESKYNASQIYGCPEDMPSNSCLLWSPITQKPEVISRLGLAQPVTPYFAYPDFLRARVGFAEPGLEKFYSDCDYRLHDRIKTT